jgi:hypothetical protein
MVEGSNPPAGVMLTSERARQLGIIGGAATKKIINDAKKLRIDTYNLNPTKCKNCNIILSYNKRHNTFCSQSCAAKYNNLGVCRNPKKHINTCPFCKGPMSNDCKMCRKCHKKILIDNFTKDMSKQKYIKSSLLRPYYENLRGHKCEECGITTWNDNPITLHAHHIDGNSYNNKPNNILLLCPNCHSQTSNYCSKNRGNGKFKVIRIRK